MSYDSWKTSNPDDQFLGPEPWEVAQAEAEEQIAKAAIAWRKKWRRRRRADAMNVAKLPAIYLRREPAFSQDPFERQHFRTCVDWDPKLRQLTDETIEVLERAGVGQHPRVLKKRRDGSYPSPSEGDIVAYNEPEAITPVYRLWYWWEGRNEYDRLLRKTFIWCSYWDQAAPRRRIEWLPSIL